MTPGTKADFLRADVGVVLSGVEQTCWKFSGVLYASAEQATEAGDGELAWVLSLLSEVASYGLKADDWRQPYGPRMVFEGILADILQESGLLRKKSNERLRQMEVELENVEKKLRRWEEAFENGELPADLGVERMVELRDQRDELRQTLKNVIPIQPPPPHLFAEATVNRFKENVRSVFVSGDNALTKHYLRFLVSRVEVTDAHVRVLGRTEAVAQLLAQKEPPTVISLTGGEVLATVSTWLRRRASNARIWWSRFATIAPLRRRSQPPMSSSRILMTTGCHTAM